MTRYTVRLTHDAERDLAELVAYVAEQDAPLRAEQLLDRVLATVESLETSPERGSVPAELRALGLREYRQVFFKPYRLIYRVHEAFVIVYVIADGRRDVQSLLARRLLRT